MKTYHVAILGASGAVGKEIIHILEERNFPIHQLTCLASKKSVGKTILFHQQIINIKEATSESFHQIDIVFGAVDSKTSAFFAPFIQQAQALYVDNSSYFRLHENVPLVIPEVNAIDCFSHQGIIANPNCSTIIACIACSPLHQLSPLQSMIVTTFQAVSGAGIHGITELKSQMKDLVENKTSIPSVFHYPIACNVIPQIGSFQENEFTEEEIKMQVECRKIFHQPQLDVTCTCVRVPIFRTHSLSITCQIKEEIQLFSLLQHYQNNSAIKCMNCPMPINTSNQDLVTVGRIRKNQQGITLWCCGDQLRKGAATNAVQIAEYCHENNLILSSSY